MVRIDFGTLAVCLLVLLAGCSGLSGEEPPDREPYGVDETVPSSVDSSPDSISIPISNTPAENEWIQPGLTDAGIVDGQMFFYYHEDVIAGHSYTMRTATQYVDQNATVLGNETQVLEFGPEREEAVVSERADGRFTETNQSVSTEYWADRDRVIERIEHEEGPVEYSENVPQRVGTPLSFVIHTLSTANETTVTDLEDGSRLEGQATGPMSPFTANETVDIELVVRDDGLIQYYELEGVVGNEALESNDVDGDEQKQRYIERGTYTDVGETTPAEPAWLEEALEELGLEGE